MKKILVWITVCIHVLLLSACDSTVSSSVGEPMAYAFEVQYIRTDGYVEDRNYPYHQVIRSREELETYYEANKAQYDLERKETIESDGTIGFLDASDRYDEAYFADRNLILIVLEEGSGSIRHKITEVCQNKQENGALNGWNITIERIVPEIGTDDMAQWHFFLEIQMGDVITKDDIIWINGKRSVAIDLP